jgi:hypothetical protein
VVDILPTLDYLTAFDLRAQTEIQGWQALLAAGLVAVIILVLYFYYFRAAQRKLTHLQQRYVRRPSPEYSRNQSCPYCRFPMDPDQTVCPKCKRLVGTMRYKYK